MNDLLFSQLDFGKMCLRQHTIFLATVSFSHVLYTLVVEEPQQGFLVLWKRKASGSAILSLAALSSELSPPRSLFQMTQLPV